MTNIDINALDYILGSFKSHSLDEYVQAIKAGKTIWLFDSAASGNDDALIEESDVTEDDVQADITAHFELEEWPEEWSLTVLNPSDVEGEPTMAEKISENFYNDGQCFEDSDGLELLDVCHSHAWSHDTRYESERFIFDDHSVITVVGAAWDLGFEDCWCWAEEIDPDCPNH